MINHKLEFIILKKQYGMYFENSHNSEWLTMLAELFSQGFGSHDWIKRQLVDPSSRGITGNSIDTTFKGNKVFIEPLYTQNPAQYRIETDRDALLKVILDFEALEAKRVPEIIITRDQEGTISVAENVAN